jgi:hypothetical protein
MPEDLNLVNKLYYGDKLIIMRKFIPDECVDHGLGNGCL